MATVNADLFIYDEEYIETSSQYKKIVSQAQEQLNKYFDVVDSIRMTNAMSGSTANLMFTFWDMAYQALSSQLDMITSANSTHMVSYIQEIDEADEVLYEG